MSLEILVLGQFLNVITTSEDMDEYELSGTKVQNKSDPRFTNKG